MRVTNWECLASSWHWNCQVLWNYFSSINSDIGEKHKHILPYFWHSMEHKLDFSGIILSFVGGALYRVNEHLFESLLKSSVTMWHSQRAEDTNYQLLEKQLCAMGKITNTWSLQPGLQIKMGHSNWSTKRRGLFFQMQTEIKMYKDHYNKKKKNKSN